MEVQRIFPDLVGSVAGVTEMNPAASSSRRALRAELGQQPHFSAMVGTEGKLTPCLSLTRLKYAKTSFARGLMSASNKSARV